MQMLHYYLQKGISLDKLLNLSYLEKAFYLASIHVALETKDAIVDGIKSQF